jgi:hypothetical protein
MPNYTITARITLQVTLSAGATNEEDAEDRGREIIESSMDFNRGPADATAIDDIEIINVERENT